MKIILGEEENESESQDEGENVATDENVENIGEEVKEEEESLTQAEITKTEESEVERIKRTYSFRLPVSRVGYIRIWR